MTLADEILAAQSQVLVINTEASTGAWDGPDITSPVVLTGLYEVTTSGGIDQINAAATLKLTTSPSIAVNDPVQNFSGYNGEGEAIFKGEVASRPWELPGGGYALVCRDRLARARGGWPGPDESLAEQTEETMIRHWLELYGLPSTIQEIASGGWTLGIVDEVVLEAGKSAWELISAIDAMTEYRTYTDMLGVIRRKSIFANIAAAATWTFQEGINIVSITRTPDPMWPNKVIVTGLAYEGLEVSGEASTTNANIPTPPGDLAENVQSNFVETDAQAALAAQYILNVKRMYAERFEIVTIGNPLLQPLDMVHLIVPSRGLEGDTIIEGITHNLTANQFLTTLKCFGLLNAGEESTGGFPPVASFTLVIDVETVLIFGTPTLKYFISAVSTSTDSDGTIVSQIWNVAGGSPSSGTALDFLTTLASLTSATIDLEVTDNHGLVDTETQPLDDPGTSPPMTRPLLIAAGSGGLLYYNNGQAVPLTYAMPSAQDCTAVPLFFDNSQPHAGGSAGAIVRIDALAGPLTLVDTLVGGSVGAIFINSANELHILAGAGATLYRATDGETFVELHEFAGTILDIQSSPTMLNEIRVCSGAILWISYDAATFTALITGTGGTTARMMATAGYGSAVCFTGGTNSDCIKFENVAHSANWAGVVSPPGELTTITPMLSTEGFIVTAPGGATYQLLKSGDVFTASLLGTVGVSAEVADLMRDGTINQMAYAASDEGTWKLQNSAGAFSTHLLNALPALQIGYGPMAIYAPIAPGSFFIGTLVATGADDKLWLYTPEGWTGIAYPKAAWSWYKICANPANRNQILLFGNSGTNDVTNFHIVSGALTSTDETSSPLFYSPNFGAAWYPITLAWPVPGGPVFGPVWRTDGTWTVLADGGVWNGSGTSVTAHGTASLFIGTLQMIQGNDGDILYGDFSFTTGRLRYLPLGSLVPVDPPDDQQAFAVAHHPTMGTAINAWSGANLRWIDDYTTDTSVDRSGSGVVNAWLAFTFTSDGKLYALSGDDVYCYDDISASDSRTLVGNVPGAFALKTDSTGTTLVALRQDTVGNDVAYVYDGVDWVLVELPGTLTMDKIWSRDFEVLE